MVSLMNHATCIAHTYWMMTEIERTHRRFLISEEALPWPQAQYECLNLHGQLAELPTAAQKRNVVRILKAFNRTGSFWVGASDFERGQRFTWFNNGSELMLEELDVMPEEDKDQRCIQVRESSNIHCAAYPLPSA